MKLRNQIIIITISTVLTILTITMVINTSIFNSEAKNYRKSEIQSSFYLFLEKINFATNSVESIGFDLAKSGELFYKFNTLKNISKIDLETYLMNRIQKEKLIFGAGFWFEPNLFGEKYMGPYVFWENEKLKSTWEYSNEKYNYHKKNFYRIAIPENVNSKVVNQKDQFLVSPYLDKINNSELLFLTVSTIMYSSSGKILGVTTVDWTFEELKNLLSKFELTPNSYAVLIDNESSKIIYHPKKELITQDSKSLKWISKLDLNTTKKNEISIFENQIIDNSDYDIYYTITNSNFILATIINKNEAYSIVSTIVFRNILTYFGTVSLIALFIYFLVDLSIKPLTKIMSYINDITIGKKGLNDKIIITSKNELGELAITINEMVGTINKQNIEMKRLNSGLETKVEERTSELTQAISKIEKLAESRKKLSVIGEMASGIVHDIKNPMATIRAFAEMLNQSDLDDETRKEYTGLILREIDRLSDMTFEILDFSKGNISLNLELNNVPKFLNEIYEFLKLDFDYANIKLELNCNYQDAIFFDRDRLRRVIINLANNAREAMSDNKKGNSFIINAFDSDEGLLLNLTDNGPGLPASLEEKIFEAFATEGKANGTGLGLYMSKLIIEQHNGTLTYETKRDIGTTFTILIPKKVTENNAI